jgi:hypothetical protein
MTFRIPDHEVASIRFVRPLNPYTVGSSVDGDEFRSWPEANRRAIVDQGFVELVKKPSLFREAPQIPDPEIIRVVVPRADDLFDVVEGKIINAAPLSDEDASALAEGREPARASESAPGPVEDSPAPEKRTTEPRKPGKRQAAKKRRKPRRPAVRAKAADSAGAPPSV